MSQYFSHSQISALQFERQGRLSEPGFWEPLWTFFAELVDEVRLRVRARHDSLRERVAAASAEPCIDCA